jgi:hypothetical protein
MGKCGCKKETKPKAKAKQQTQEIKVMTREEDFVVMKGNKKPNRKLLIDNPFYIKKFKQIERKPDS